MRGACVQEDGLALAVGGRCGQVYPVVRFRLEAGETRAQQVRVIDGLPVLQASKIQTSD